MIEEARRWICDGCGTAIVQTGYAALESLPKVPYGWALVDTTRILPPRTVGKGVDRVKVGASREIVRKVYCPFCDGRYGS